MARVVSMSSFCIELFDGAAGIVVEASNLFQLIDALDRRSPGFAEMAGLKVVFAVDGVMVNDWAAPLPPDCEVLLVPRVGGG